MNLYIRYLKYLIFLFKLIICIWILKEEKVIIMVIIKPFINLLLIKWVILYIPEENSKEPYKILSKIGLIDIKYLTILSTKEKNKISCRYGCR